MHIAHLGYDAGCMIQDAGLKTKDFKDNRRFMDIRIMDYGVGDMLKRIEIRRLRQVEIRK